MPYRRIVFVNNEVYHILNRGVGNIPIYESAREHTRFLELIDFYRYDATPLSFSHFDRLAAKEKTLFLTRIRENKTPLVEVIAYCLMPNHFHLMLRQQVEGGIQKILTNTQNGYVKFFNTRNKRKGPLFQSVFKAIRIESDEQLLHTSRYIHLNPCTAYMVKASNLASYPWSSFPDYLRMREGFVSKSIILDMIGNKKKYEGFVLDQAGYQREIAKIKHLTFEDI